MPISDWNKNDDARRWAQKYLPDYEVKTRDGKTFARRKVGEPWINISEMTLFDFAKIAANIEYTRTSS